VAEDEHPLMGKLVLFGLVVTMGLMLTATVVIITA